MALRPQTLDEFVGQKQLRENLGAVGLKLTAEQIKVLDEASKTTLAYPYWHQRATFTSRNPPPV